MIELEIFRGKVELTHKMKQPVKIFGPNLVGRDFVIGDLHGSLNCLENLLVNLNFDSVVDRMFSVGDLVDRGPDSMKCLELINEDWFHAVIANHEQLMLEALDTPGMEYYWNGNGGGWCDPRDIPELVAATRELPYLITVKLKSGKRVHIIHAEFPPGTGPTDELLEDPVYVHRLATQQSRDGDWITWGRFLFQHYNGVNMNDHAKLVRTFKHHFKNGDALFNENLSPIISGHTIMHRPITILGQTNIDTKAFGVNKNDRAAWNALTCIELDTWKFYQATHNEFKEVQPVVVNRDDIDNLGPL